MSDADTEALLIDIEVCAKKERTRRLVKWRRNYILICVTEGETATYTRVPTINWFQIEHHFI